MRAVIYCRVSTKDQAQNLSLPTQEKASREYCARNGYDVDETFVDAGESAKTTDRPEFRRMLEHCRRGRGRIHAVIVYSLTRFSRNTTDHHAIAALLRGLGITIRSVTEPIDESPSGRLMEGILAAMAQFDNDIRSERVIAGMKAAIERGRWVGSPPIGYLKQAGRGPSLVPDPERAPAIREAFELCARGISGRALLDRVTAMGLTTRRGTPVTISRLYEILRRPVYTGFVRNLAWQQETRGDFEALTSEETFGRAQLHLNNPTRAEKASTRHLNHRDFPLRRFARCGRCGGQFTGSWSTGRNKQRYAFYHCRKGCERVAKNVLESAFIELLDRLRPRPEYWRLLEAAVLDVWRSARAGAGAAQAKLTRTITTVEGKLARLDQAYVYEQAIDRATYQAQRDELREQLALTKIELSNATVEEMDVEGMLAFAQHVLEHASALWTAAATTERRIQLQWVCFPQGLSYAFETFQNPISCWEFFNLGVVNTTENGMVDLIQPSWKHFRSWLQHMGAAA